MSKRIAHDFNAKWRSDDVITNEAESFSSLHLDERILAGLSKAGYTIPSPVQLEAIPLCLTGKDVFVQGKAGTGKTLVFSILALTAISEAENLQVLILALTREGAFQIYNTINAIGCEIKDLKCECFIGGFSYADDIPKAEACRIAVGTPGRIYHLISEDKLNIGSVRLFVIDDVDELLHTLMHPEVTEIFEKLPAKAQTVVTSLTCTNEVLQSATEYLDYRYLACYCEKVLPPLLGMTHYYRIVLVDFLPVLAYRKKLEVLKDVLMKVKFSQCIVFCNSVYRVDLLRVDIKSCGFSVASMTKAMEQVERLQALELLKKNKCKVFMTTDVGSRGLDAENVDLVINFDMPVNSRSYLHRCGRAGRYGAKCSSITLLTSNEKNLLIELENEEYFKCYALPEPIPEDLICGINPSKVTNLPCKPQSSGCNSRENGVTSLAELSKNAIMRLEKTKAGESCSLLTANKIEEQSANLEIVDANHPIPDFEVVKPELPGNSEIFSANQGSIDFVNTEAFNKEHDIKNCEESSRKSEVLSNAHEVLKSGSEHYDSDALSSECKPLPLNDYRGNLIVSSCVEASETKIKQYLKKTDTGNECKTLEDCRKNITRIPRVTRKKKNCNKNIGDMCSKKPSRLGNCGPQAIKPQSVTDQCKGQMKSRERQVMFHDLETTSESGTNQSCIQFCSGSPANHSDKKHKTQSKCGKYLDGYGNHSHTYWNAQGNSSPANHSDKKHKTQSNCGKYLDGYGNHSHTYWNAQGNSFPGRKIFLDGNCSCCNCKPCCSSSQHCSFPNYNYQNPFLMHGDMFYKQYKFINDFSYFLSHFHP